MGVRGEIFSTKVALQNRTYFFNVKENRLGDLYLNIVESKNRDEGGFDRQSVILFADDLQIFLKGFDESLRVLEKAVRDKRKAVPKKDTPAGRGGYAAESESFAFSRPGRGSRERERDHEGGRGESDRLHDRPRRTGAEGRPRRTEGEYRPHRTKGSPAASTGFRETGFRERKTRRDEGQGRPREGYRNKDKPPSPPKKRIVVKRK